LLKKFILKYIKIYFFLSNVLSLQIILQTLLFFFKKPRAWGIKLRWDYNKNIFYLKMY
jgi:hypothetical protein